MGVSTSFLADHGVVEVEYSSEPVTAKDLSEQRKLVADTISKSNITKVLLVASALERFPSVFTLIDHNKEVLKDETLRTAKFAVVCASLGEDELFLENIGVNRGINIRCFISREKALSWLTQQSNHGDVSLDF